MNKVEKAKLKLGLITGSKKEKEKSEREKKKLAKWSKRKMERKKDEEDEKRQEKGWILGKMKMRPKNI